VGGEALKGEALLSREAWEEAVCAFERAFESSDRSDRDVSYPTCYINVQNS
jgi:hypothetical protein